MEEWKRWKPELQILPKYYVRSLHVSDRGGLEIFLNDAQGNNNLCIRDGLHAFYVTEIELRKQLCMDLEAHYGEDFYKNWTFFTVKNSEFYNYLREQSDTLTEVYGLQHFCILAENYVIDILYSLEPEIKFL